MHNIDRREIYVHLLVGLSSPQTLNIVGYINKHKFIVFIDSSSTHNFIDKILSKSLNCFIYPMTNFKFPVANGGEIDSLGKFHNIKHSMGEYNLETLLYSIPIGGVYDVLGVQWLRKLGTVSTN
jgi:hypothetical protein